MKVSKILCSELFFFSFFNSKKLLQCTTMTDILLKLFHHLFLKHIPLLESFKNLHYSSFQLATNQYFVTTHFSFHVWGSGRQNRRLEINSVRVILTLVGQTTNLKKIIMTACVRRSGYLENPQMVLLQIYTNHTNDPFQIKNCEFRRKETSQHPFSHLEIIFSLFFLQLPFPSLFIIG